MRNSYWPIKFNFENISKFARLGFIRNATDRVQVMLTVMNLSILLVALYTRNLLELNVVYSTFFIILTAPLVYWLVGKLLARVKRTLKTQERFVSNIAHELNNSMTSMQLDSELALRSVNSHRQSGPYKLKTQELISALNSELSGLRNMSNIIKNLSIITSYEYRPGQLGLSRVNLSSLLTRLCKEISTQSTDAKSAKVHINTNVDDRIPVYVSGNATALEQMIINLLNNAIKYSPIDSEVTATISTSSDSIKMSVKDNGIGMSESDVSKIFDPFYRSGDKLARQEEGSGLGLAIVKAVAEEHDARISVKSILKEGTEISINFPATAGSDRV